MKSLKVDLKTFFLAFFSILFCCYAFSFSSHAQAMPSISSPTYTVIDGGQTNLINGNLISYGLFPFQEDSFKYVLQSVLGTNPYLQPSDFTIRPLTDIERENIESGFTRHFYNENGEEIPLSDLYYVSGDNGYLHSEFYMDSGGNVLYGDLDKTNTLMNFGFSHGAFNPDSNYANWDAVYSDVAERIEQGNFNYYPGEVPSGSNTYFTWVGYGGKNGPSMAGYILIPNQNIPGQIVPLNSAGTIYQWYTNDLSLISSVTTLGNYQPTSVRTGNYSHNGYSYRYLVSGFANINGIPDSNLVNYDDWVNGTVKGDFIFGRQGIYYNELNDPDESIGFKKVRTPEIPIINPDELYNYDELALTVPEAVPDANPDFNPQSPIVPGNYPISYPYPGGIVFPSDLPLPGSNPGINPLPGLGDVPIGDITPDTVIPENIPILSDLQYRFPFSIPFDIYRLLRGMAVQRETPYINRDFTIPGINYTWHIEYDLHAFDDMATLFRLLQLISFIIGLAYWSYNHFFGT